jgi:hypothetical protein
MIKRTPTARSELTDPHVPVTVPPTRTQRIAMPTKITIIYDFLASQLDGMQRIESSKVWPKKDGAAVTTPAAGAFFTRATGGVQITFAYVVQSRAVAPA